MNFVIRQLYPRGKSARADEATTEALMAAYARGEIVYGDYLEWSDPNAKLGMGDEGWTADLAKAKRFASRAAAMECWRARSKLVPTRSDGRPNRPLTAWSITVEEVPDGNVDRV